MQWINLQTSFLRSPQFIGSDPVARATWLCVLGYCVEQENGGRIVSGAVWKDRQWQQMCGVTLREVRAAGLLLAIDGQDVVAFGYPTTKQVQVQAKRIQAANAARIRWDSVGGDSNTRKEREVASRGLGKHTPEQWERMVQFYGGTCLRCAKNDYEKDHVIPVYKGGSDSITNLQPLCPTCNVQKGSETTDWRLRHAKGLPDAWNPACVAYASRMPNAKRVAHAEGEGEREVEVEVEAEEKRAAADATPPVDEFDLGSALIRNPPPVSPPVRAGNVGDLLTLFPVLAVFREDRGQADTLLALYGWTACQEAMRALEPVAKARPKGKHRVMVAELAQWLKDNYNLDPSDYARAGLPQPGKG